MRSFLVRLLRENRGEDSLEYALLLVMLALIVVAAAFNFGLATKKSFDKTSGAVGAYAGAAGAASGGQSGGAAGSGAGAGQGGGSGSASGSGGSSGASGGVVNHPPSALGGNGSSSSGSGSGSGSH
jgi:Flp pilus assembly pilin Flp